MRATTDAWRAQRARGAYLGAFISLLVHGLAYALLSWAGTMPPVDFKFELPSHVEFGVSGPIGPEPTATPPNAPAVPPAVHAAAAEGPKPAPRAHARKPAPADAGVAETPAERAARATREPPASRGERPALAAFAPAGAQLALRLHMALIRDGELAEDVRALLEAVPDWRMIVDGSGLDPLRDLERLYLASPDLRRESLVIAGQYAGGEDVPLHAVENLASARGVTANFHNYGTIPVAPWANADETERVVALIAPHQFAITRPDDLPRVLQVARALARRRARSDRDAGDPGDALLALGSDEVLAFSVEGARLFVRGNLEGIPDRLEISVRTAGSAGFNVQIQAIFDSADAASSAQRYWTAMRDRFAGHPLLALIGLRGPLADARLSAHSKTLEVTTKVSIPQARIVLGFVQSSLRSAGASPDLAPARLRPRASPDSN